MNVTPSQKIEFPVSKGQEQLWFLNELNPESQLAYTMVGRISIQGELDRLRLQRAVNNIVSVQEVMRTSFSYNNGKVTQVISPSVMLPICFTRCTEDEDALERLITQEARRGWSLRKAPLYRFLLIQTADDQHELIISAHHITCDGISLQLLLQQIFTAYQTGEAPRLSEQDLQFVDYAVWSRQQEPSNLEYWCEQLSGAPTVLNLPLHGSNNAQQSFAGSRVPVTFPSEEWSLLRPTLTTLGISSAALFLGAYCLVLHRLADQEDLLIGVPVSNRLRPELSQVIGYLTNLCVFRSQYNEELPVCTFLQHVQCSLAELVENGETSLLDVLQAIDPTRQSGTSPLFQVMFGYEQDVNRKIEVGDLQLTIQNVDTQAARLDLSLFLFEDDELNVSGFLEYAADRMDRNMVESIATMMTEVVRQLLTLPNSTLAQVSLGTGNSLHRSVACTDGLEGLSSVVSQIAELAATKPNSTALCDCNIEYSFSELQQHIEMVHFALNKEGVTPGRPIVLIAERSVDWVVVLIAIWRAGGIAVPLDPSHPTARLSNIVAKLDDALLITDSKKLMESSEVKSVAFTALRQNLRDTKRLPDLSDKSGYIMFTSGSTGEPKGVVVSQANLVRTINAFGEMLNISAADRMLALTTFSFDISLLEIFLPLVCGGSVMIAKEDIKKDGQELAGYLADPRITLFQATPSGWSLLLSSGWQPRETLTMLCGGEMLPQDIAERLSKPGMTLWNLYGPTETTIWSTACRIQCGDTVRIGYPISGTHVAVVDNECQVVPKGISGELLIGGLGVSLGYYRNGKETAKKYIPSPWDEGQRAYLTGDRVRMLQDGELVYLGRRDEQIKLRGHRIELSEIEYALRQLPEIQDAAVKLSIKDENSRIQAYIQVVNGVDIQTIETPEWEDLLRKLLPEQWLPKEYYLIKSIPLTPNGKRDKQRLDHESVRIDASHSYIEPRNDTEAKVQEIWCTLLGLKTIGVTDDFFQLGGHSILVARMVEMIESEFDRRIPIADIYVAPTVARVAATLDSMAFKQSKGQKLSNDDWEFTEISLYNPIKNLSMEREDSADS